MPLKVAMTCSSLTCGTGRYILLTMFCAGMVRFEAIVGFDRQCPKSAYCFTIFGEISCDT